MLFFDNSYIFLWSHENDLEQFAIYWSIKYISSSCFRQNIENRDI